MKEEWLMPGAIVPVNPDTTKTLVDEIKRLIGVIGGMALQQAEKQEPRCAVIVEVFGKDWRLDYMSLPVGKHRLYTQEYVYTTPPAAQRQWVGLTDDEVNNFAAGWYSGKSLQSAIYEAEAKLKEKNT
jgi:hypothetical protein